MIIVVTEKHQKTNVLFKQNPFLWSLKLVTLLLFEKCLFCRHIDVIYNNQKRVFLRKLFCYESLVDIGVSKHKNILSLTRLIALVVVTSSLMSTP